MAPADAIILRHGAPQFNDNWPLTQPGSLADKAPHLANVRFAPSKRTCAPLPRYVRLCQFLEDWICEDNPVRAIDVFVDELDLAELGFGGVDPEATGRPAYHPSVLLKLYIYGYLNRVQSSRRLEREAGRNVEVMWLTGRLAPDHKTIADFRKDNGPAIRKVCARFIALCREIGLLMAGSVAIDGSKFKAVNNRDKNFTRAKMERRLAQIEQSVARYLSQLDTADLQQPSEVLAAKTAHLKEKLAKLATEVERLKAMEKEMLASPDQQISLTDPDSRSMATSGRGSGVVGYNVQVAVDTEHHLIVAHEVTNTGSDRSQLANIASQAKDVLNLALSPRVTLSRAPSTAGIAGARAAPTQPCAQSTSLAPAALITLARSGASDAIAAANCAGEVPIGTMSSSSKRLRTSGSARMRTASRWSLAMIGSGVPAGASSAKIARPRPS
jgi:transposase